MNFTHWFLQFLRIKILVVFCDRNDRYRNLVPWRFLARRESQHDFLLPLRGGVPFQYTILKRFMLIARLTQACLCSNAQGWRNSPFPWESLTTWLVRLAAPETCGQGQRSRMLSGHAVPCCVPIYYKGSFARPFWSGRNIWVSSWLHAPDHKHNLMCLCWRWLLPPMQRR